MTETLFNELPRVYSNSAGIDDVVRVASVDSRICLKEMQLWKEYERLIGNLLIEVDPD